MQDLHLNSIRDALFVGIPLIVMLAMGVFRLDGLLASARKTPKQSRPACGLDENGQPIVVDPDGRPSPMRSRR